jgi:hypothetical protein
VCWCVQSLTHRLADEVTLQVQSRGKDYRNGKASQADWFTAKLTPAWPQTKHTTGYTMSSAYAKDPRDGSTLESVTGLDRGH